MPNNDRPSAPSRIIQAAFGIMALVSVLAGLALWQLADTLHLPESTARAIATAFIVAGVADTLVLFFWDRLFGGKR